MRSQKHIESEIAECKRQISEKQKLQVIVQFAGSDSLLALFNETKEFYQKALNSLDPTNPALNLVYSNNKVCMNLVDGWIKGMSGAEDAINKLKKQFLDLNEELGKVLEEQTRREKMRM
jgi:hypothetical protein